MANVVIYSSNFCPFCHRAKALLKQKGVNFKEISVDMKPSVRKEMRQKAGGVNSVPQIWIGNEHVGGCDDLYALEAKGGLDTLLAS
ncbi:glutaredoxin 3 [Kordiimonas sp. SCSIO 12610]|uniref:glutaredoxin 3 n=1 Tax=Kordiimonas sp. SCSIO 12610 TaxID=2829597 RepID=UPI00210878B6|nr:glutaredoxin 3 [Kordiimonas sp. SCSIO 12610]UTW55739.1 glutaredoxin 3 [Kordiimonas sp. SCSIO 12610]